ncbi:MAG: Na(+)/H(+) antiporter subunit D [Alphaproteobacteria bacterium]|jgi:multicomponent Na+:H+ antiporter subunit D|nr:Na(+)/H(+) antiporter subunit D [Alphaproteobacteria bacterium]
MIGELPPALLFVIGALILPLVPRRWQSTWVVAVPVISLINLIQIPIGVHWQVSVLDYELTFGRLDKLSFLFGLLFHIAAIIAGIFALHLRDPMQHIAALLYAGSAIGAVLAGDLVALFIFWEIMAVSSVFLIWARRTERANRAGLRYLIVQIASGVILFAGIIVRVHETGSTEFGLIGLDGLGGLLIFLAFGIKCAFPLLHTWLTDAYPEATPTGTVFLSAFTTKVAVYCLARSYPGTEALIYIGATMTMFPIFFAVIENDLRRVLGYSMINQIGFMVVGIGLGTELALNGAVSHAFNDVVFKGLLFMSMGAVLHMTGRIDGTDLGGLYKTMPITATLCIVGAASISAFPLFSGFVSKSMVMASAAEEGHTIVFLALLFASAGVFHHAGIKIPFFAFFAHDSGLRPGEPPINMLAAMVIAAVICVFNGSYPWLLYELLPWEAPYEPYTLTHVITQSQLLFYSALAFTLLMLSGLYPPEMRLLNLDIDWTWRRIATRMALGAGRAIDTAWRRITGFLKWRLDSIIADVYRHHGPRGVLARTWPTGSTVLWVAVLLAVYLVIYFI